MNNFGIKDPIAKFRYEYQSIPNIKEIITKAPIAIVPIGILEWHGEHSAVGMDGLVALEICERTIMKLQRGVLMPLHWIGTYGFVHYEGTICYEEEVTTEMLSQLLSQIVKLGFKFIILLSGHGGRWQVNAIKKAVNNTLSLWNKPANELTILGAVYPDFTPWIRITHAGVEETSILWRIGEKKGINLVDITKIKRGPEILSLILAKNEESVPIKEEKIWDWNQNLPNPERCSPQLGENILQEVSDAIVEEIKTYCEEMKLKD
jgi:creatinine amidohydrolase/Fe(II)-dependent formamide hydrolase-like protein